LAASKGKRQPERGAGAKVSDRERQGRVTNEAVPNVTEVMSTPPAVAEPEFMMGRKTKNALPELP
jgi:hypothetical protein